MFKNQTKSNNQRLNNNNSIEKEKVYKKTKKVNYNDYLKLKNAYILLQENLQKIKEENEQLKTLLQSYQEEISKNEDYKLKISQSFQTIEKKFNNLINENKEL